MPSLQHEVVTRLGRVRLDFAYVEARVAIEADGFRWHSSRKRWDGDRERALALGLLGWTVVRVTWTQLHDRPDDVVETIRALLARNLM